MAQERVATLFLCKLFNLGGRDKSNHLASSGSGKSVLPGLVRNLVLPKLRGFQGERFNIKLHNDKTFDYAENELRDKIYDYQYQENTDRDVMRKNEDVELQVRAFCVSAMISVDFLRLLQGLFAIEPNSCDDLRNTVQEVFSSHNDFANFMDPSEKAKSIMHQLDSVFA